MQKLDSKLTINVSELSSLLGIGKNSAYTLVNGKNFPKIRIGRKIIIPITALKKWLEVNSNTSI